jgi:XRE family transcriptional regulator, regulator of sulfur utilization
MNIGKTIREIRKRKGLSQQQLAQLSNVSQTYISLLEKKENLNPSIDILSSISNALDIPYPVIAFLSLEEQDIAPEKRIEYPPIERAVNALVKEFFLKDLTPETANL